MVGNHTPSSQQKPQPHKSEQPLRLCDLCGKHGEPVGGVMVRDLWRCARCWVKFMNQR